MFSFSFMKKFVRTILAVFFFFCLLSNTGAQNNYWQQQVNYNIKVELNDKDHSLDAFEQLTYTNNSPDTLKFIWFHVWMNAYKNDRTAFSDQMISDGRTDFYFAPDSMKGYVNHLSFKVNNVSASIEEHPTNVDIIKLVLPSPLPPHQSITITTPFHDKLPYNFSRGGHIGQTYQITQWYPKPAVYDKYGWHEMPYLNEGEFFSEFGNFHVQITLPDNYIVAATGNLQNKEELDKLIALGKQPDTLQPNYKLYIDSLKPLSKKLKKDVELISPPSSHQLKTLVYEQDSCHDFAWFASKTFLVQYDTLQLASKNVNVFSFYNPWAEKRWNNSVKYAKDGLRSYSSFLREYAYNIASVVSGSDNLFSGGMEYPTITLITAQQGGKSLDEVIAHELGHNWFYGVLATNERDHAWMDEGMNTFFQEKYQRLKYGSHLFDGTKKAKPFFTKRIPDNIEDLGVLTVEGIKKDQPIETTSANFSELNYGLMVYSKTAMWMQQLEQYLGKEKFDAAMKQYYKEWGFKHPYPEDFKNCIEQSSGKNIDSLYQLLFKTGYLQEPVKPKKLKFQALFSLNETDKYNYVTAFPSVGYNYYDHLMIGATIHNYSLPLNRFQFFVTPMYATGSNQLNVFGRASYNIYERKYWLSFGTSVSKFTINSAVSGNGDNVYTGIFKTVPSVQCTFYNKDPRSSQRIKLLLRSFIINEGSFLYGYDSAGTLNIGKTNSQSIINQLKFTWSDSRVLYPYSVDVTVDQGSEFIRAGLTGKYFFNYANDKGGIGVRFFAGKFFYTVSNTYLAQAETERYHLNMTGPKGSGDYTYSDYFIGRNEYNGWMSQQIMERDGFFKVRTDLYANKVGETDNWLMALNLTGNIPRKYNPLQVLPFYIPLKVFVDIGTYAEAWQNNTSGSSFLYDAGFQFDFFKSMVNIYVPILYSGVYKEYNTTVLGPNNFWKTISFNINLNMFQLNKLSHDIPL